MPSVDGSVISNAMWAGDIDLLNQLAPCRCCCADHTFEDCPARSWFACRGQNNSPFADRESWFRHYEKFHGMTREQFFDWSE